MKKLLIPIIYSFLTLVVIETGLTIYLNHLAPESVFLRYASYKSLKKRFSESKIVPHRYLGYALNPDFADSTDRHNTMGFRGKELNHADSAYRIVCIGGSTTYGTGVDSYKLSYPFKLEKELRQMGYDNVEVINAGVPGYGSLELLLNYGLNIKPLKPDLLVVYTGINDIVARLVWPKEAFKSDNSGYRTQRDHHLQIPLYEYSSLIRSMLIATGLTSAHSALTQIDPLSETSIANDFFHHLRNDLQPTGVLSSPGADSVLRSNGPGYFKANLRELIMLAGLEGTDIVLSPFLFDATFYQNQNNDFPQVLQAAIQESNLLLEDLSGQTGVTFIDLASLPNKSQELFKDDGIHFSEKGNEFWGKILAKEISILLTKKE